MNIEKLLDFAEDYGMVGGVLQNMHPEARGALAKSARNMMKDWLKGYVLVPVQLIQNIDDLTESGFGAEDQIDELCNLIKDES